MEKSKEKSENQAYIIKTISMLLVLLDANYCREASDVMHLKAKMQESLPIYYPPNIAKIKTDILKAQAKALSLLCDYVDKLKEIDQLKSKLQDKYPN